MVDRVLTLWIAALVAVVGTVATLGFATPAQAQCQLCSTPPSTEAEDKTAPVKLEVETNLDFDRLIMAGTGAGSAVLGPDGSRSTSGAVISIGGRAMVGTVTVHGEPGRSVRVSLPLLITLNSPTGGQIRVDSIRSDLSSLPRIGSNGSLSFRFGGELHVSGGADGDFRGDFSVDVDYL